MKKEECGAMVGATDTREDNLMERIDYKKTPRESMSSAGSVRRFVAASIHSPGLLRLIHDLAKPPHRLLESFFWWYHGHLSWIATQVACLEALDQREGSDD